MTETLQIKLDSQDLIEAIQDWYAAKKGVKLDINFNPNNIPTSIRYGLTLNVAMWIDERETLKEIKAEVKEDEIGGISEDTLIKGMNTITASPIVYRSSTITDVGHPLNHYISGPSAKSKPK